MRSKFRGKTGKCYYCKKDMPWGGYSEIILLETGYLAVVHPECYKEV